MIMFNNIKDRIIWVAAMLEGEGSFWIEENGTGTKISIQMIDSDTIERVKNFTGSTGSIGIRIQNGKDTFYLHICGNLAIQWMMTIYPLMSIRRKQKIRDILVRWKTHEDVTDVERCAKGLETKRVKQFAAMWGISIEEAKQKIESLKTIH